MYSDPWIIIACTIVLSAFFSGIEIAFLTANKLRIELKSKQGAFWAEILSSYVKKPSRFISTLLVGSNISLVLYAIAAEQIMREHYIFPGAPGYDFGALFAQVTIATTVFLVFAEFLPKIIFRMNADNLLPAMIVPFRVIYYLLWPVTVLVNRLAERLLKRLPDVNENGKELFFTKVDLDHYISESIGGDSEEQAEVDTEIFKNALDFDQVKVRECMIPRNELVAVELHEDMDALIRAFVESGHSKVIVYDNTIDQVIGYVHQVDLFKKPASIRSVLMPILITVESMPASELLKEFTAKRKSIAVVVDEFGGTAGIVTIEDIMEEIFGEIDDEHDVEDLTEEKISDTEYIFSARLEVDYLNEAYELNIPTGEYETLGGYIISRHESIPTQGEILLIDRFEFYIIGAENSRIGSVRMKLIED